MTMGGTFWVLAVVCRIMVEIEDVGGGCSSAYMSQIMLMKFVTAFGSRGLLGFINDVFGLSDEMQLILLPFFTPFAIIGAEVFVTMMVIDGMVSFSFFGICTALIL